MWLARTAKPPPQAGAAEAAAPGKDGADGLREVTAWHS